MRLRAYIDGASRGNPGESGIALILKDEYGRLLFAAGEYVGAMTNNEAEYTALERCLETVEILLSRPAHVTIHSDSELIVRQVNKEYAAREPNLKAMRDRVWKKAGALTEAGWGIQLKHIPREENKDADALVNRAVDWKLRFPAPPRKTSAARTRKHRSTGDDVDAAVAARRKP